MSAACADVFDSASVAVRTAAPARPEIFRIR